ncbi:MAG: dTMP kinase [Oscillospiraceae bacterium]
MGRLIVLEGIDGSGKSTQFKMLCERLEEEKRTFQRLVFPQYSEPSSALLRMYLAGEFGTDPESVNAYAASTFFAVDRYASYVKVWRDYYNEGGLVLADRYTTSNAIHQASKITTEKRAEYLDWLYDFEFRLLELPRPDAVIYMDVPLSTAVSQMRRRETETKTKSDIHEADTKYLEVCRKCGLEAAELYGWHKIKCTEDGVMRPLQDIHEAVYSAVRNYL